MRERTVSYSLRWCLSNEAEPKNEPTEAMLTHMNGMPLNEYGEQNFGREWLSMQSDMLAFSCKFPDCVFAVYVTDWADVEHWVAYYHRGKTQEYSAEIVFPQPKPWRGVIA